jgi:hypothetical protein
MKDYFEFITELRRSVGVNPKGVTPPPVPKLPTEPIELRLGEYCDLLWVRVGKDGLKLKVGNSGYFEIPRSAHAAIWEQIEERMSEKG